MQHAGVCDAGKESGSRKTRLGQQKDGRGLSSRISGADITNSMTRHELDVSCEMGVVALPTHEIFVSFFFFSYIKVYFCQSIFLQFRKYSKVEYLNPRGILGHWCFLFQFTCVVKCYSTKFSPKVPLKLHPEKVHVSRAGDNVCLRMYVHISIYIYF